jgi:hypothetical protein
LPDRQSKARSTKVVFCALAGSLAATTTRTRTSSESQASRRQDPLFGLLCQSERLRKGANRRGRLRMN